MTSLSYLNGKITVCGGAANVDNNKCWKYNIRYNEWTELTSSAYIHGRHPSVVYDDKLYYFGPKGQSEVYDPLKNVWQSWPSPPVYSGVHACSVVWRDTIILIGGSDHPRGVQMFNLTTNSWKALNTMPPITRYAHACSKMPNDPNKFMIVGGQTEKRHVAIYDASIDYWSTAARTTYARFHSNLVVLGKRIFVLGGYADDERTAQDSVEEYLIQKDVWETKNIRMNERRDAHSVLSLPASLFDPQNLYTPFEDGCIGVK
jgi:N-acetylneuraminic acid mutarotase